jgi:hypothetical protein
MIHTCSQNNTGADPGISKKKGEGIHLQRQFHSQNASFLQIFLRKREGVYNLRNLMEQKEIYRISHVL